MDEIPEKLSTGEALTTEELLEYLPALKEVPGALLKRYAVGAAVRRRFRKGEIVCEEGEFGSTAFYIVSGNVNIYIRNPLAAVKTRPSGGGLLSVFKQMKSFLGSNEGGPQPQTSGFIPIDASIDLPKSTALADLGPGELFGEMTCRNFQPRSATVEATEDCVMVELLRVVLDMLVGTRELDAATKAAKKVSAPTFKGTSFKKSMDDKYRARSLVTHLRGVPIFGTLDLEFFNHLRERAELVSFSKNEVICRQNEPSDSFFLIRTGLVRVSQKMPLNVGAPSSYYVDKPTKKEYWMQPDGSAVEGELVRTYLKRGEFFGEIGLLEDAPRNATCSALDAVDLVKIGKADFQLMIEKFPIVRATLQQTARARVEAARERKVPSGLQLDEFISQGLYEAQNLLLIDLDNCTRCDACVNACADAHEGVTRLIRDGLRYDRFLVATACRSCRDPLCMTQCPVGSIRRKESLEIIIEDWCIGCTKCAELCPYGNINMVDFQMTRKQVADLEKADKEREKAKQEADAKAAAAKAAAPAKIAAAPVAAKAAAPSTAATEGAVPAPPAPVPAPAAPVPASAAPVPASAAPVPAPAAPVPAPAAPVPAPAAPVSAPAAPVSAPAAPVPAPVAPVPAPVAPVPAPAAPVPAPVAPVPAPVAPVPAPAAPVPTPAAAVPAPAKAPAVAKAAPAPKSAAAAPAKPAAKVVAKAKAKDLVTKATTCDLCTQLSVPSCVYACPHDAAKRVDPTQFLARQIGSRSEGQRFRWLNKAPVDRTTH